MNLQLSLDINTICPLAAFDMTRAYVIRGLDGRWLAKTMTDGEVIANADCRSDAMQQAEQEGYHFHG